MALSVSAQDNVYAERIKRTIKNDYLEYWNQKTSVNSED